MKRAISLLMTWLTLTALATAAVEPIGKVVALEGKAHAVGSDGAQRALTPDGPIYLNDRLVTAGESKLQFELDDGSVLSQGENSEMVIDEYVYQPGNGEKSSVSLKLIQGLFRTITGKITELNPERFRVRTRMATIGIRGCELCFRITRSKEDVLIIDLPPGHSVAIQRIAGAGEVITEGHSRAEDLINLTRQGTAVSIQLGLPLKERSLSPGESQMMIDMTTPQAVRNRQAMEGSASDKLLSAQNAVRDTVNQADQAASAQALLAQTIVPPAPPSGPQYERPTTPPQIINPPAPTKQVMVMGHPEFDTWEWGIWDDGSVQYYPNRYLGNEFLTANDFQNIAGGTTTYNLNGSGQAGALLHHADGERQVMGSASLQVTVGGSATPAWGGAFNMSNPDGDHLSFDVDKAAGGGAIGSDGKLSLQSLNAYSMQIYGHSYDISALTDQSVNGQLIKAAGGSDIIGASGKFSFKHSDATANGAFGVNLAP